jgi:hypothetical protein
MVPRSPSSLREDGLILALYILRENREETLTVGSHLVDGCSETRERT